MGPEVLLLLALLAVTAPQELAPPPSSPQPTKGKLSKVFTLRFENDSIPDKRKDSAYTQGMELRVAMDRDTTWKYLPLDWIWSAGFADGVTSGANVVIGHAIFTPQNIITYTPRSDDRPFSAYFYVGAESVRVRDYAVSGGRLILPRRMTFGVTGGTIGPLARGRDAQSAFHVLTEERMAKGWLVAQLPNRLQINGRLSNEHVVFSRGGVADLTLMEEGVLGTTQTYAGFGATIRLGVGLSGLPASPMTMRMGVAANKRKAFEVSARVGGRIRAMWHNAFVSGPLGASNGLQAEDSLEEWHFGVEARAHEWRLTCLVITQGREITNQAAELPVKHRFVAFNLSREVKDDDWDNPHKTFRKYAAGSRFNIRLGRARTSITPHGPVDHKPSLAASWGIEHALPWNLSAAWEKTGATREGGPPVGGVHTDQFLLANAFTLGWETPSKTSRHKLQVRAGGGWAKAKYQVTPDTGDLFEPVFVNTCEKGKSVLAGVRYSIRLGGPVSATFDAARARLTINKAHVTRSNITTFTLGVQIHPWHRDMGK